MKYRPLGNTGLLVSEIGFGGWAIGGPLDLFGIPVGWGKVNDAESESAIRRALDLGVNFFDTADIYGNGHSEELLGKCLPRSGTLIATKVGNRVAANRPVKDFSEQHIRKAIEMSLKRLQRNEIDVYQLHNPPPEVLERAEVFEVLKELKKEGKIRYSGVSISRIEDGIRLIQEKNVEVLQVLFNVLNQEPGKELFPLAESYKTAIVGRVPLASGLLSGKFKPEHEFASDDNRRNYLSSRRLRECLEKVQRFREMIGASGYSPVQVALAFVLRQNAVSVTIPGAKTADQVEENVSACDAVLSEKLFRCICKDFSAYNFYLRYGVKV